MEECLADTDTYLFRIIEVDPDTKNVKLIKSSYLVGDSNYMFWYDDGELYVTFAYDLNTTYLESLDISWPEIIKWYDSENSDTAFFRIGLMNVYDYGYAASSTYWTTAISEYYGVSSETADSPYLLGW